jgi:PAS domain S-box-containing protein
MAVRAGGAPSRAAGWNPVRGAWRATGGLRQQTLWWLCVAVVFAIAALQVYDVIHRHEIVIATTERSFTSLVRVLSEQTARAVQAVDVVTLETAADAAAVDWPSGQQALQQRLRDRILAIGQVEELFIAGADGKLVAAAGHAPPAEDVSHERYFQALRNGPTAAPYLSDAFQQKGHGHLTLAVSRRIDGPDGSFRGVAVAYLDLSSFQRFYAAIDIGPGRRVELLREDGVLLAAYPVGSTPVGASRLGDPSYRELLSERSQATLLRDAVVDGEERLMVAQAVAGLPLWNMASADKNVVLAAWRESAMHSAVRTTLLCAGVLVLMWLMLRQLRVRERAEERLRVQSAHLDELFESAPEGIVTLDPKGRVTRVNREFTQLFGYGSSEARGKSLEELIVPQAELPAAQRAAAALAAGRRTSREMQCVDKIGRLLRVSVLAAPIVTAQGLIGSYAIYRDLTERELAQAERDRLEARVRQGEKLEVIGTMAGGIAHDFNNILAAMLGYLEMAMAAPPEPDLIRRHVSRVMKAAQRARSLVEQILSYSRTTKPKSEAIDLAAAVDETLDLIRAALPPNVELRAQLDRANALTLIVDATQLHQLTMNLCTNAVQAMPEGGVLSVTLSGIDVRMSTALSHGDLQAGRYASLVVEDTGCGMDAQTLARIFEPFFTTKPAGMGTGLGLALVHGTITELGGAIDVRSSPGQGTRFEVYLPRSDARVLEAQGHAQSWIRGAGQRLLIVDDERFLMLLAEEMLAALHYEPAGFTRPDEALKEFLAAPERFDCALLDQVMPGISGMELARRLREVRPDLPVILVSGYVGPQLEQEAAAAGIDRILTKPIDLEGLARAVAEVLPERVAQELAVAGSSPAATRPGPRSGVMTSE